MERLRELCARMESRLPRLDAASLDDIALLNLEFHREIRRASHVAVLPDLIDGVTPRRRGSDAFRGYGAKDWQRSFAQHREIVDAIEAGDGEWAGAVTNAHVLAARATLSRRRG